MSSSGLFFLLTSVIVSAVGQLFLKLGAVKLSSISSENFLEKLFRIITIPDLWTGLSLYGIGAFAYILLLSKVSLSTAAPSTSLIYVFSFAIGYFVFGESIGVNKLFGLSSIILGVILINHR